MILLICVTVAIWYGIWWRFRGGALTTLTGFDPGTGGMRAIAAIAMAAPMVSLGGLWWMPLAPALWIGWSLAGWGAFQSMGASPVEQRNHLAVVLSKFMSKTPMCVVGMAIEGSYTLLLPAAVAGWATQSRLDAILVVLAGVGFSPIYLVAQRLPRVPNWGEFASGRSEWAEVGVGLLVGIVLSRLLVL